MIPVAGALDRLTLSSTHAACWDICVTVWTRNNSIISRSIFWTFSLTRCNVFIARHYANASCMQSAILLWQIRPSVAPCGLRGCKNWPAPFPGRMSYKATKPGLVSVLYLSMHYMVSLFIRAPFYVLLVFIAMCAVFWLFLLSDQNLPSDWLERLVFAPILLCFLGQLSSYLHYNVD